MASEELLTVEEVAGQLKVNPQTVRNWIDRGELGHIRVGSRRIRVRRTDLDQFLIPAAPIPKLGSEVSIRASRETLREALRSAEQAGTDDELATAIRAAAKAANALARVLEKRGGAGGGRARQMDEGETLEVDVETALREPSSRGRNEVSHRGDVRV